MKHFIRSHIHVFQSCFNEKRYWKLRNYCQTHANGFLKYLFLIYLRRIEAKQCADTGLGLNTSDSPMCNIEGSLNLPHRLNGIIIGRNVRIGKNVTIYQNVTIAECDPSKQTIIGDNVLIGANAVVVRNVIIGKGSRIGANSVVINNIPEGGGGCWQSGKSNKDYRS